MTVANIYMCIIHIRNDHTQWFSHKQIVLYFTRLRLVYIVQAENESRKYLRIAKL